MNRKPRILVVGSLVMDLIVSSSLFPNAGETVIGKAFSTAPGGKGANQAVQAARLGADVTMVGMVGEDDFGRRLRESAAESGVNTDWLFTTNKASSAVGNVQIQENESGTENRIIVVPGANYVLSVEDVAFLKEHIAEYDMVVLQLEIDMAVNCAVAQMAKEAGVPVMLNPAPSAPLPGDLLACLTYICPNEHEAEDIVGIKPEGDHAIDNAIAALHDMGVEKVLITLGKAGCAFSDGEKVIESPIVSRGIVVDPTAAGDSFIGAFCTAVAAGVAYEKALVFANCTAGITVSRMGAQTSLPTFDEVMEVLKEKGLDTEIYQVIKGE